MAKTAAATSPVISAPKGKPDIENDIFHLMRMSSIAVYLYESLEIERSDIKKLRPGISAEQVDKLNANLKEDFAFAVGYVSRLADALDRKFNGE